jgi:hypothetical protein
LTESNVKTAFTRAALTAGTSVPTTFGETRNTHKPQPQALVAVLQCYLSEKILPKLTYDNGDINVLLTISVRLFQAKGVGKGEGFHHLSFYRYIFAGLDYSGYSRLHIALDADGFSFRYLQQAIRPIRIVDNFIVYTSAGRSVTRNWRISRKNIDIITTSLGPSKQSKVGIWCYGGPDGN